MSRPSSRQRVERAGLERTVGDWWRCCGAAVLVAVGLSACVAGGAASPYPLYDASVARGPDEVATLGGAVARVDGREVGDLGSRFALLPGCHVVELPASWGRSEPSHATVATLPRAFFVFQMRAGHHYSVEISSEGPALAADVTIDGYEVDAQGTRIASYPPQYDTASPVGCVAEE